MHEFRITQTRPLTNVLPYEVEQHCRVWYLPWPIWSTMQERSFRRQGVCWTNRRFQTVAEAQAFIEQVVAQHAQQQAKRAQALEEQRQRKQARRVVQVFSVPVPA